MMMSLSQYVWIFSLAEALALSLILTTVFGVKWWRLRRRHRRLLLMGKRIADLVDARIAEDTDKPDLHPPLRENRLSCLTALSSSFRKLESSDEERWKQVLERFEHCFEAIEHSVLEAIEQPSSLQSTHLEEIDFEHYLSEEIETLKAPTLDTDIAGLISQYQLSMSTLDSNLKATNDLGVKYVQLQKINQELRAKLEAISHMDTSGKLRQELDQAERCNQDFVQAASTSKRNFKILTQQCSVLEEHIEQLKATIASYRRSAHQLIVERDSLADEVKALIKQLEMREKLVERLNHNYDVLRQEYNKLYGVLH